MAVHLQFEGIRCFIEPQDVALRPITLLVGENSSGKTTFLALCQIAHAIAQSETLPFNEPPFSLGAFEQIAAVNGRVGRAKSFSLTIILEGQRPRSLRALFASRFGQPAVVHWQLISGGAPHSFANSVNPRLAASFRTAIDELVSRDASAKATMTALQREFASRPYAFAPIRTSPRRTYDPVSAEPNPEGSHIPMLLATLARSAAKQGWSAMQSALQEYGSNSGLFDGIEIVNKGMKESDPFQIGVKTHGPTFNLIDVGYGVSQALPILVETVQRASGHETFLLQQPEVHLHPRAQAELGTFFARQADKKRRFVIETHSDYLVDRIRMEVRRKTLKPHDVSLLYFERGKHGATIHTLELDRNGSITNPPEGYRQFFLNEERDLLGI